MSISLPLSLELDSASSTTTILGISAATITLGSSLLLGSDEIISKEASGSFLETTGIIFELVLSTTTIFSELIFSGNPNDSNLELSGASSPNPLSSLSEGDKGRLSKT